MKTSLLAATLITFAGSALAQVPSTAPVQSQTPGGQSETRMPMGPMMQGRGMPGSMMGGPGRRMMGWFSPEDMNAFIDAHIAAIHAGLKLNADQEKLWPPVESAMRNLATLHLGHMQAMRETPRMMTGDPVGMLRAVADRMSQGADAMRKLADAASPLYATLDEAQKRRLQVLVRMGSRAMMGRRMMGPGMMGSGGGMMDDDDEDSP